MIQATLSLSLLLFSSLGTVSSLPHFSSSLRPLVIWHGLGDSYDSDGIVQFESMIRDIHPDIYIYSVYMSEDDEEDRRAGFYGHVNEQIAFAAEQFANVTELRDGFDAIGFSQGGQFLRAYVEMYNTPPIHNLLTFGSQHMGISDIPQCGTWDLLCQIARRIAKGSVYGDWAQSNLVQAQYYRDPHNYQTYLQSSQFLASINNEIPGQHNTTYAKNFASLNKLVLAMFSEDTTVIPPESSWFGAEKVVDEDDKGDSIFLDAQEREGGRQTVLGSQRNGGKEVEHEESVTRIVPMRRQPLYLEDWIGLRKLDEAGKVTFEVCQGGHMDISSCWKKLVQEYVGQPV